MKANLTEEYIQYSINTFTIAKLVYLPVPQKNIDVSEKNYTTTIRKYLSMLLFKHNIFLNEEQAIKKYGKEIKNTPHPNVYVYKTDQGVDVYIEPYEKENIYIVKCDSIYFSFFFALTGYAD